MKKLFIIFSLFLLSHFVSAQTSVYFCPRTGAVGYAYGNNLVSTMAYNNCVSRGAISPVQILYQPNKGYGAISIGYTASGARAIGVAAGYFDLFSAQQAAKVACSANGGLNPFIYDTWVDY